AAFDKVIHLKSDWPNPLVARAGAFESAGDFKRAAADYRLAIKRFPKSETAHDGMAWFLATCREASFRDGKEAVREATLACELAGWKDPYVVATLAAALAETGDFAGAVQRGEQALKAPVLPSEYRQKIEKQLASYRANKPWRDLP